ncbi:MAG: (Fe-S)-binding protein [Minwuia sp.]|uniref:(Fe-S)-binding protein n=1 Tax=Minwuia sp. TaxID=2493630 RepID=UPI003A836B26
MTARPNARPDVGLFVTCLVDLYRPSVGFAADRLIRQTGCTVTVPLTQTCCGQPAYNSGDRKTAKAIARQVIAAFEGFDYVVAPSGSCMGMISHHYPALFGDEPDWKARAETMASKSYELVSFLTGVCGVTEVDAKLDATVTYHDSCSGLRELKIKEQPRRLLATVDGLSLTELPTAETCCGFGGTFCIKYSDVSTEMVRRKAADIAATEADLLLAGDMGCLLNMAGKLKRDGSTVKARHVAEVLAGMTDRPAIGEAE